MNLKIIGKLICLFVAISSLKAHAQQVNIGGLKNVLKAKPIILSGGASANNVFTGAANDRPESFNYCFQGNLNANVFGQINLPFSYSFTNAGASHTQPIPPNRFDLHPTYKWINGHIGQVTMSFSPYTLNGHQFSGAGVDLSPDGPWKISAMVGELQKPVAYDTKNPKVLPSYQRMGYGGKIGYEKDGCKLSLSTLYAKDDPTSLSLSRQTDSLLVFPQQNLAMCYTAQLQPMPGFDVTMEYANSALTINEKDAVSTSSTNYLQSLMGTNKSTTFYSAIKGAMNYTFHKSTIGLGYEHVDPNYRTMGAYFFNNDFENITLHVAQTLFKDQVSVSANMGLQHDNLDGKKSRTTERTVASMNLNYTPTEKLQMSTSYSNFKTYMNMQSAFQKINQPLLPIQNSDTLNFVQISQNANFSLMLATRKDEVQSRQLNVNVSFQDASDEQGGKVAKGSGSQFYNLASTYHIVYLKKGISLNLAYNITYNTIGHTEMTTHGPTVGVSTKLLKQKMNTGVSTSYNTSTQNGLTQNNTFNIRLNTSYTVLKSHKLNLTLANQYRSTLRKADTSNLTGTLGYSYSF